MAAANCIIPANPDVAGIGVRLSIYIQAASAVIPASLKIMEDKFREQDLPEHLKTKFLKSVVNWENIEEVAMPSIFLGVALFISSVIQAHIYGLTVYHALVLLNLHLIIAFSVAPYFIVSGNDKNHPESINGVNPAYVRLGLFHIIHLSCAAGFGLWLFGTIHHFDRSSPNCTTTTTYFALGKKLAVTSRGFRDFWITIYAILVIPYVNSVILLAVSCASYLLSFVPLLIPALIIGIICGIVNCCCTPIKHSTAGSVSRSTCIFLMSLVPGALMVFITEAMVKTNHVSAGENVWTFGQTIAILIAILPLWRVLKQTKATISRIKSGETEPGPTTYPPPTTYSYPSNYAPPPPRSY